ncbi:hypothetical protein Z948_372 [Sulfitobacter donghicola DSW-25 = KCTC 12864 = JCM 14565]|nr:hypothetical protein Z948_372 [Sulfitobacter donghicola DSW-25 = KCTC 12864 = JCM 14565]
MWFRLSEPYRALQLAQPDASGWMSCPSPTIKSFAQNLWA